MIYVNMGMSLNSIGCVTKCGPVMAPRKPTDVCKANVLNLHTERFEVIFRIKDEECLRGATK